MITFKEFLEEAKYNPIVRDLNKGITTDFSQFKKGDFFVIPVKDLGNWAWDGLVKYMKNPIDGKIHNYNWDEWKDSIYARMAIACLGKKEVEKRLKELK